MKKQTKNQKDSEDKELQKIKQVVEEFLAEKEKREQERRKKAIEEVFRAILVGVIITFSTFVPVGALFLFIIGVIFWKHILLPVEFKDVYTPSGLTYIRTEVKLKDPIEYLETVAMVYGPAIILAFHWLLTKYSQFIKWW